MLNFRPAKHVLRRSPIVLGLLIGLPLVGLPLQKVEPVQPSVFLAQARTEKSLLWEISGRGLQQPSYLYGTLHLACPNQIVIPNQLKAKFAATQQLYLELDLDDPQVGAALLQSATALRSAKPLNTLLTPQDYALTKQYFQQNLGVAIDSFNTLQPILLVAFLYPVLLGCEPDSWDQILAQWATQQNRPVLGLETVQEQVTFLTQIPLTTQAQMLMAMVRNPDQAKKDINQLLLAYQNQDLAALYQIVKTSPGFNPRFEQVLLEQRNRRWIATIAQATATKPTFFAVGAAHLGGKAGLINLLRQEGYTVKPVTLDRSPLKVQSN